MGAVVRLVNGSRATARDLYFVAKVTDLSNQAKISQNYIFYGVPYDGEYEVTPTASEQHLDTANKLLKRDVTVHEVPYYQTSNESGGYTVSILS